MDSYQFYKSLYDRELNRRKELDAAINTPLTLLTFIIASNSFTLKYIDKFCIKEFKIEHFLCVLIALLFLVSIFYLTRSYNNFFKGFSYRNIANTKEIRKYEIEDIEKYNIQVEENEKINFENILIDKLNHLTDNHIYFNDKRSHDIYIAKTAIIVNLILTVLNFIILASKYILYE